MTHELGPQWTCKIQAIDKDGKVIDERITHNMLNTDNWGNILAAMFTSTAANGTTRASVKDSTNTADLLGVYATTSITSFYNSTSNIALGPFFQLGTGSTAASRADHVLQTPIAGTQSMIAGYVTGSGVVSMGGTITYGANQTPSEAALYLILAASGAAVNVLIDHQVFTALAAALTFTVAWTITLQ